MEERHEKTEVEEDTQVVVNPFSQYTSVPLEPSSNVAAAAETMDTDTGSLKFWKILLIVCAHLGKQCGLTKAGCSSMGTNL